HPVQDEELQNFLRELADADLLHVRGIPPNAVYCFKHALIRDASYESLLKSRRKELHQVIADAINEKFTDFKQTHPEVLARHWTEAGETERAIVEWLRAGKTWEERYAFKEALDSYQRGLSLLKLLPKSRKRDHRELEISQSVLSMLYATRGY